MIYAHFEEAFVKIHANLPVNLLHMFSKLIWSPTLLS